MKRQLLMTVLLATLSGFAWAADESPVTPANAAAAERVAISTCAICHGQNGRSTNPKYPVLAGQHMAYLQAQLHGFKAQTRGDPDAQGYMWGMSSQLSDEMIDALADYYSRQSAPPGAPASGSVVERGQSLYNSGDVKHGVPPCGACHGPNATGTDLYPRLAGQHAQYLLKQLRSFQSNMRNVAAMHGVASQLQEDDMRAVAAYLETLH